MPTPGKIVYLDTSALVKCYVAESGGSWIVGLCDPSAGHEIATARVTKAEAAAAFANKHRSGDLLAENYQDILRDLTHDFAHQYVLVEIDQAVIDLAVTLEERI